MANKKAKIIKPLCKYCIKEPEKFARSIMPLSECFRHGFHVHGEYKNNLFGGIVFKDEQWQTKKSK